MQIDGSVGWQTWQAIVPVLHRGSRGTAVKTFQSLLNSTHTPVFQDGYYGAQTEKQVRQFQKGIAIVKVNGRVGATERCYLLGGHLDGE